MSTLPSMGGDMVIVAGARKTKAAPAFRSGAGSMESMLDELEDAEEEERVLQEEKTRAPPKPKPKPADSAKPVMPKHVPPPPLEMSASKKFCLRSVPEGAVAQCHVTRDKGGLFGGYPSYAVRASDGGTFLMSARRRKKSKTANYLISIDEKDTSKDSPAIVGKVRADDGIVGRGRLFHVYSNGDNPKDVVLEKNVREELAFVEVEAKEWGDHGPTRLAVAVPSVSADGRRKVVKPLCEGDAGLLKMADEPMKYHDQIHTLRTREAVEHEDGTYMLDFGGRVTKASVKNIQLDVQGGNGEIALQFGRVDKDEFTLDVRWPLSPVQAFGICLVALENNGRS